MKLKIKQPTSLKDIKLSQYQKFLKTTESKEDENYIAKQMVGIFCNIPDDVVGKIRKSDYNALINDITTVLMQINSETPLQTEVTVNGIKYGFIPNIDDITVDEQGSIDSRINDWSKMHEVMSILYRPITTRSNNKYLIEEFKEVGSLDLTMDVVNGAMVFFYTLLKDYLNCIQNYIEQEVAHNPKLSQTLAKNGLGIKTFINSLEETFLTFQKLVSYDYMKR